MRTLTTRERVFFWLGSGVTGLSILGMIMGVLSVAREERR